MANAKLFSNKITVPATTTTNHAGGKAYSLTAKQGLAQYASTGTFGDTYYVGADTQLKEVLDLAAQCDVDFIAKCAVYSRTCGYMKDMPALLLAHLCTRGSDGLAALRDAFPLVVDNSKMLRNFVQIVRSGVTGRKSLGSAPKAMVAAWIEGRYSDGLFRDNVGESPSIADCIRLSHPKAFA